MDQSSIARIVEIAIPYTAEERDFLILAVQAALKAHRGSLGPAAPAQQLEPDYATAPHVS